MWELTKDLVSFIANITTIIGLIFAIYVWRKWRVQENYSFVRDQIFKVELSFNELISSQENIIHLTTLQQLSTGYQADYAKVIFNEYSSEIESKLKEYNDLYTKFTRDFRILAQIHIENDTWKEDYPLDLDFTFLKSLQHIKDTEIEQLLDVEQHALNDLADKKYKVLNNFRKCRESL